MLERVSLEQVIKRKNMFIKIKRNTCVHSFKNEEKLYHDFKSMCTMEEDKFIAKKYILSITLNSS